MFYHVVKCFHHYVHYKISVNTLMFLIRLWCHHEGRSATAYGLQFWEEGVEMMDSGNEPPGLD